MNLDSLARFRFSTVVHICESILIVAYNLTTNVLCVLISKSCLVQPRHPFTVTFLEHKTTVLERRS